MSYVWSEYAISQLMKSYRITYRNVVVDCDPGTEIFPRKILDQVASSTGIDYVITVLDGSRMSLDTASEIKEQVEKRKMNVKKTIGVCNRVDEAEVQKRIREVAKTPMELKWQGSSHPTWRSLEENCQTGTFSIFRSHLPTKLQKP